MWERGQDKDRTGGTEKRGQEHFLPNMFVHSLSGLTCNVSTMNCISLRANQRLHLYIFNLVCVDTDDRLISLAPYRTHEMEFQWQIYG